MDRKSGTSIAGDIDPYPADGISCDVQKGYLCRYTQDVHHPDDRYVHAGGFIDRAPAETS
jgi:hypothetical protein